jgi:hypothetical protein
MSGPEPVSPSLAARMAPLLREWALLRERERDLFRRMAEVLEQPPPQGPAAASDARGATGETAARRPAGEGGPNRFSLNRDEDAEFSAAEPSVRPAGALPHGPGGDPPADPLPSPPSDPSWVDRTIEAVLAGAFSADPEPEENEPPAVDLLLLRSGDIWVAMPWDRVAALGLSDDALLPAESLPLSLRALLGIDGNENGNESAAEPYRLTWETAHGLRALSCEVLGGVVAASAVAARGVELVWLPDESATGGRLVPLVDFFALGRGRGPEEMEVGPIEIDEPTHPGAAPESVAGEAGRESPPTLDAIVPVPGPSRDLPSMPPASCAAPAFFEQGFQPAPAPPLESPPSSPASPIVAGDAADAQAAGLSRRTEASRGGMPRGGRSTSYSALVSVRYLPARVAISRALRSHGWFVVEAVGTEELPAMLQRVHHTAVFTEAPERPEPGWLEALVRARDAGTRIIAVSSRLRGTAGDPLRTLGPLSRLLYPFQEVELERLIESPVQPERG